MANTLRMKNPSHPGSFIKMMVIEPLDLKVSEAAKVLGITRPTLSNFLNAHASLSPEMAIRLDKAFGVDMETLMHMQTSYDIAQAKRREGEINVAPYVVKSESAPQPAVL